MRIVVASNPAARFGRSGAVGALVAARIADLRHEVTHIAAADYAGQLEQSRFAMIAADALVVVGGDGMVHLGVNIVGGTSKPLLVVPAGSGNDFASAMGVASAQVAIDGLEAALAADPDRVDLIRIEHPDGVALAAGVVSVGFDADVNVRSFRLTGVPSRIRYQAAILATVLRPRHRTFRVRLDGGPERTWRTLVAAIANNRTFGGGIPIAPDSSMRDGRLTAVFADELSYPSFLRLLARVLRGTHTRDRRVTVVDCETAELASDETVIVCADGEIVGRLPVRCSIMPGALRVLRPR
ncbi:diacylglycerol kinase family protein [Agrococcus sp. SCSIO52902]|uniref:diacylglycerol/lipid kinase family protein n=1 Tax=Agrococcus sp. SCSIO52902 TaxID=2933290 RepID=UPI001FF1F48F|nr:diacylglycerol kinase family protein [Agrococcus sp. SCSIO52902]UOW01038.1 diacylglycerol kinase family lipid kinase [Agrococcus sp. SCSIO52902]